MKSVTAKDQSQDILCGLENYHRCMLQALTDELDLLLAPGFVLVHITGYVQTKSEWLAAIRSGEFDYHRVELTPDHVSVAINANNATVAGRGIFHATIQGLGAPWRLAFTLQFTNHAGRWLAASAHYTTY